MQACRLCGEEKPLEEFHKVMHFTKVKRHKVIWCRDCQKMYMEMKKEEEKKQTLQIWNPTGIVSFD